LVFSPFSKSQTIINVPQYGLYINGQVRFSPGDGFTFGKQGGAVTNTFQLIETIQSSPKNTIPTLLNYGWQINSNSESSILNVQVSLTNKNGLNIYQNNYTYQGLSNNTNKDYSVNLTSITPDQINGLRIYFSSNQEDSPRNWPGYRVSNMYTNIRFDVDECAVDVLSSNNCKGYSKALVQRLCSINSQLSPECPGYRIIIPSLTSPIPDTLQSDVMNSLINPLYMLIPNSNSNKPEPVNKQSAQLSRENKSSRTTATRKNNDPDPQGEKLQDMQSNGPDISAYSKTTLKDAPFYAPREIYRNVRITDNIRAERVLTQRSNISHGRMVDEQYRR
jgi:hypothetical protein